MIDGPNTRSIHVMVDWVYTLLYSVGKQRELHAARNGRLLRRNAFESEADSHLLLQTVVRRHLLNPTSTSTFPPPGPCGYQLTGSLTRPSRSSRPSRSPRPSRHSRHSRRTRPERPSCVLRSYGGP